MSFQPAKFRGNSNFLKQSRPSGVLKKEVVRLSLKKSETETEIAKII